VRTVLPVPQNYIHVVAARDEDVTTGTEGDRIHAPCGWWRPQQPASTKLASGKSRAFQLVSVLEANSRFEFVEMQGLQTPIAERLVAEQGGTTEATVQEACRKGKVSDLKYGWIYPSIKPA
jgi:hypothetical protein